MTHYTSQWRLPVKKISLAAKFNMSRKITVQGTGGRKRSEDSI